MRSVAQIEQEIQAATALITNLKKELNETIAQDYVVCRKCEMGSKLKETVYIQTHWYVRPYSCTGGDYWNSGEGQFLCPKCNTRNRLLSDAAKVYEKMAHCFKEIRHDYDDPELDKLPFVNL